MADLYSVKRPHLTMRQNLYTVWAKAVSNPTVPILPLWSVNRIFWLKWKMSVACEDRICPSTCSMNSEMGKYILVLMLSSYLIIVVMVSATLVRAPLSCSRGTVRACQFFSFAMRYYAVLTLLISLLEMYANYDVTEVSVGHRIWIIRAVSYELLSFGQFGVWGWAKTRTLFSELFLFFHSLQPRCPHRTGYGREHVWCYYGW